MKVQAESFHLNGHIIGFRSQTQKLESPYKTPSNTLAVKGLMRWLFYRYLAHNGEINTIRGNINNMNTREGTMFSKYYGSDTHK